MLPIDLKVTIDPELVRRWFAEQTGIENVQFANQESVIDVIKTYLSQKGFEATEIFQHVGPRDPSRKSLKPNEAQGYVTNVWLGYKFTGMSLTLRGDGPLFTNLIQTLSAFSKSN